MAETSPRTLSTEAPSNCVRLYLARVVGSKVGVEAALALATMRQELESCGEIARVEHLPSSGPGDAAMRITFWDKRSAAHAKKAYGSMCSYEPQDGSLTVTLTRDSFAQFHECQVARAIELGDDLLEVDFFDSRVASSAMVLSASCSTCATLAKIGSRCDLASCETASDTDRESVLESATSLVQSTPRSPSTEEPQASSELRSANDFQPKFLRAEHGLSLTQLSWGALEKNNEWRTELRLRGLPPCMCDRRALEEVLKSLGLLDAIESVQVPSVVKSKASGWALLRAKSVADVPSIAKAFHGRVFRGSRMPIAVSFADGSSNLFAASRQKPAKLSGFRGLPEPRRVVCSASLVQEQDLSFPPGLPIPVR